MTTCTMFWRICRRFAESGDVARPSAARVDRLRLCAASRRWPRRALDPASLLKPSSRQLADLSRRLHRSAAQPADADHAGQRAHQLTLAWSFQTGQTPADQGVADPGQRRDLHHDAGQHLGDRRALGAAAVALHLSDQPGLPHRPSRRRRATRTTVYLTTPDAHLVALDAQHRQGEMERRDRRREARLLVHERAAGHPQSPAGRRRRRLRQPSRACCSRSIPRPARISGRSTARLRPARRIHGAAAPPAGRCG